MEYEEVATVRNFRRQLEFPRLKWLEKSKFEEYLKENRPIYPYMIPEKNGDKVGGSTSSSADDNADDQIDRRIFIGRSIDTHVTEGALYGFDHYTDSHLRLNLELVGTVSCSYSKTQNYFPNGVYGDSDSTSRRHNQNKLSWKLSVCNSNKVYEIYENFLVLCLDTESAYEWKNCALFRPLVNQSYPHPVGACVDRTSDDLAYIGRVKNRHGVTDHFGQVCLRNREFNGVADDVDFTTHEYEVLCLRPTPSKLKVQCRELIRDMCNRSNERMDQLASELPRSLVNYVKYGSYVSVGECVIRGEKLVSYDQSFELEFKQDTGLAYRPLKLGRQLIDAARPIYNKIKKFKCCFYNYFEDRSPFRDVIFTYPAVESIWLLSNKIVVHTSDGKTRVTYNYGIEHPKYVLTFDCFTMIENFLNNTSANVFRRRRIKHL